jgi:nicotinamidase-related amidase
MQTSFDLYNKGYEVFVIDEAVGSRDERHKSLAIERMMKCGISLINFEMLVFELIRDSKDESFKELSKYITR